MNEKKYIAFLILGIIALLLLYAAWQLMVGIALAAILFVLLKPLYLYLNDRYKNPTLWAAFLMVFATVVIIIPIATILIISIDQAISIFQDFVQSAAPGEGILAKYFPEGMSVWESVFQILKENVEIVLHMVKEASLIIVQSAMYFVIQAFVMYLLLFYMFVEHKNVSKMMRNALPFNAKNSEKLANQFHSVIKTAIIGNGIVSIIMGLILAAGFYVLGIGYLIFWAVIAIIVGFIPVLGLQIIWIPLGIFYILTGDTITGIALLIFGFILSYVLDPMIRQKVQFRIGKMHGLITLLGMIIGIMFFGPVGIVVGPMVLTFAYLLTKMIREEYVPNWQKQKG